MEILFKSVKSSNISKKWYHPGIFTPWILNLTKVIDRKSSEQLTNSPSLLFLIIIDTE